MKTKLTTDLLHKVKNNHIYKKDYFIIDIDSIDYEQIICIIAKVYSFFIYDENNKDKSIKEIEKDLKFPRFVRLYYSSSKTGFHIKVNKKNTILENIYYRSLFNDDAKRLKHDIIRLNMVTNIYDVCFNKKLKNGVLYEKEFVTLDLLNITNVFQEDFIDIVYSYYHGNPNIRERILNHYRKNIWDTIYDKKKTYLSDRDMGVLKKILRSNNIECSEEVDEKYINIASSLLHYYKSK